jgi:DNA-binding transcriptional regulator YiaG
VSDLWARLARADTLISRWMFAPAICYHVAIMTGRQIQRLRHRLGESTAEFGARFLASARTVESWEQGKRTPHPLVRQLLFVLARGENIP